MVAKIGQEHNQQALTFRPAINSASSSRQNQGNMAETDVPVTLGLQGPNSVSPRS